MASNGKLPIEQVYRILKIEDGKENDNEYYDFLLRLSNCIKEYRKKNNLSNKELADQLGVTTTLVSRIESGNKNLGLKTVIKFLTHINKKISITNF